MVQETVGEGLNGKAKRNVKSKVVVGSEVRAPSMDWVTVHVFTCLFVCFFIGVGGCGARVGEADPLRM